METSELTSLQIPILNPDAVNGEEIEQQGLVEYIAPANAHDKHTQATPFVNLPVTFTVPLRRPPSGPTPNHI